MRLAFLAGAAFGLSLVVVQPASAHSPTSTPVPGLSSAGDGIAQAPDGSMWLTEPTAPGRIARIAKDGTVTEYTGGVTQGLTPNLAPAGMTITGDGQAWFLLRNGASEVGRVDATSGIAYRYKLTSGTPTSVATGADGKLWFTAAADLMATDFLGRYTPTGNTTGTTETFNTGLSWQTEPRSMVPGLDGALWFVEGGGAGRIGRIATDGTMDFRATGGAPNALGVVPGGSLWFARSTQLSPLGGTSSALVDVGKTVNALAPGPDGALWGAANGGVVRLTADGQTTTHSLGLDAAAVGKGLAAGPDGRMWMTLDRAPYLVKFTVPPRVGTPASSAITPNTATVTLDVTANGLPTSSKLKARPVGGDWETLATTDAGNGTVASPVRFDLKQLLPSTTYELSIKTENDAGEIETQLTLTTPALPVPEVVVPTTPAPEVPKPDVPKPEVPKPTVDDAKPTTPLTAKPMPATPAPTTPSTEPETTAPAAEAKPEADAPAPAPIATPAPVQDRTVVVRATRGTVVYRVPGSTTTREVDGAASIPTNSIIDTTKGSIVLSSRVNGAEQQGTFYGGEFKVKQVKGTGMTQLHLKGEMDCSTADPAKATKSAAKKARKRRHVWGQDSGGRFETHGKDSVATVRGTKWLTTDTCAGTVVKVYEGAVSVRPRAGGKAVLVKAGGRHFTPARKR